MGPFVDADHPKIKTGEISSTLEDVFKYGTLKSS